MAPREEESDLESMFPNRFKKIPSPPSPPSPVPSPGARPGSRAKPSNAFLTAVKEGDLQAVRRSLDSGISIDAVDRYKRNALHHAAIHGRTDLIGFFLDRAMDPDTKDCNGKTALHHASIREQLSAIRKLVIGGADTEIGDDKGRTALANAAAEGKMESIRTLLENKSRPYAKDRQGNHAIHLAARNGHVAAVDGLLDVSKVDVQNGSGETALHLAAEGGHLAVAKALIGKDADPNAFDLQGETPLHKAIRNGHTSVAEGLLAAGSDGNLISKEGKRPLDLAIRFEHEDIARKLLQMGAQYGPIGDPRPYVIQAAERGDGLMLKLLIERNEDLDVTDHTGLTPLQQSLQKGHERCAMQLIRAGANVNARLSPSPLDLAAKDGRLEVVKALWDKKATLYINPARGPIYHAALGNHVQVIRFIARKILKAGKWDALQRIADALKDSSNASVRLYASDLHKYIRDERPK